MGRRGPAPDPTWLQNAKGNPARRRLNTAEPKPARVPWQEPPDYFDEEHRRVWFSLCRELNSMEVLSTADKFPLERYVVFLLRWRACRKYLEENCGGHFSYQVRGPGTPAVVNLKGEIVKPAVPGPIKFFKTFPEVKQLQELSSHLMHIEDRFGLSPSARSRIVVMDPENPLPTGAEGEGGDDDFSDLDA